MIKLEAMKRLNELELDIYNYVITHKKDVMNMRLKDVAEAVHVSSSMVTRTAQKLGYEGFVEWRTEMKMEKYNDGQQKERDLNYIIDYFSKVDNKEFEEEIQKAVRMIVESQEVILFGIGLSGVLAKLGAYLLNRKGKRASGFEDFSMRIRGMYNEKDCAVVLTTSGETEEIIQRLISLKNMNVRVIVITNSASSTAAKMADLALTYYVPSERNSDFYNSATQVPVIYILESIANSLIEYGIE